MLFDWFTFSAQLVNFAILVWLLQRFLYRPVLNAIDKREKRIEDELQQAARREESAKQLITEWEEKNATFDRDRIAMMKKAEEAAGENRQQLLREARKEYDELRERLQESLENEQRALGDAVVHRLRKEVFDIAGKVLEADVPEKIRRKNPVTDMKGFSYRIFSSISLWLH